MNPNDRNGISDTNELPDRQADLPVFARRLRDALSGREGKWLASEAGLPQSSVSDNLNGRMPRADAAVKLARALNVDVEWLFGEQTMPRRSFGLEPIDRIEEMSEGLVRALERRSSQSKGSVEVGESVDLPEIDMAFAMGAGLVLADHPSARSVKFPRKWLRGLIRGSFQEVFIARGEGDSMQPTLLDGDVIIVDTSQNALNSQDRLWCVSYGDLGMIKRLRALPDGGIQVSSDNPAVSPFTVYDGEAHIIGRVVWIGRRV